ncbi:hypothetical protein GCM10027020_10540 [Nocardioides salsibiostraticola]
MASSSHPSRRPAPGSRTPTSRPRKVAGRSHPPQSDPAIEETAGPPPPTPVPLPKAPKTTKTTKTTKTAKPAAARASRRSTPILVVAIVALLLILVAEAVYLFGPPADEPIVSTERPVVASEVDRSIAVETASESIEKIVARSYETYDEQVETAASTMTETFAAQYRETTDQIKDSFVEAKTEVTVTVVAQSVMSASSKQARVLLFLNQFVTKDGGEALYSPYRAVATMEKTDRGWLVSKLETR